MKLITEISYNNGYVVHYSDKMKASPRILSHFQTRVYEAKLIEQQTRFR